MAAAAQTYKQEKKEHKETYTDKKSKRLTPKAKS